MCQKKQIIKIKYVFRHVRMANGNYTFSGLFYYLMKPYKGHPDSFRTSRCRPRQRRPLWRFPYFHFTPNLSVLEPPLPSIWLKRVNPHGSSSIFKSSPTQCLRPQVRPPTSSPLIIVTLSLKSGPWTLCFLSQFQLSEYFKKRKKKKTGRSWDVSSVPPVLFLGVFKQKLFSQHILKKCR